MTEKKFEAVAATQDNPNWDQLIRRKSNLYPRDNDVRSPFVRDYTRILHSTAYRRLKHKTQVFFDIDNDHICTRMEHVHHVASVSATIATSLGLNVELTNAIALGHDLGHAPFGHSGEEVLNELYEEYLKKPFWHEQNGLRFVDKVELLVNPYDIYEPLNLTYAVRDGIVSHCGEVDQNGIFPRDIGQGLECVQKQGTVQACTWEGCVVKIADKIAYLGRDIEDAQSLGFLDDDALHELKRLNQNQQGLAPNTTAFIHTFISDICENSSPTAGIRMSEGVDGFLKSIKQFNYDKIYKHKRLVPYKKFANYLIRQIFNTLYAYYDPSCLWDNLHKARGYAPKLISVFERFLAQRCLEQNVEGDDLKPLSRNSTGNETYATPYSKGIYIQAILDYIAGMTDHFAITVHNELLQY